MAEEQRGDQHGLRVGLASEATYTVTAAMAPPHLADVLSTSNMIRWMEDTCLSAIQPRLDAGETTVGTRVDVSHVGMARAGEEVRIHIRLVKITGRRLLTFEVKVVAPVGVISTGTHQRLVVDRAEIGQD